MDRAIDSQLEDLKKLTLEMGGLVEKALVMVSAGLLKKEPSHLQEVFKIEGLINDLQIKIDNECLQVLAKQGPVAKDLRLILSIIKINTDLERMGDQCVNISYISRELIERGFLNSLKDIEEMIEAVTKMVKASLDSFVKMDPNIARSVLDMDDAVDNYKKKINQHSIQMMKTDVNSLQDHLDFILIARNLERLGDHATNIAEDVIFAFTGKDIRHGSND
ncbi:phosphate signaling complex protein PhoU [Pseudobdellovibrio exovorus]|uniref:Phosphate-specific transport system accessory protein PhoU n=1 Tax=Pseudobdellovibrio exovorus JSS TaxID=1184267 RepID=M4VPI3_9BACT|nr:phosphate signaling complex protein PhoU [Pseudobdellovibrio exovorus]AGH95029.1 phosphate transport system regulatory protein [Pseudobdellovibrio exovorus JSS]